MGCRMFVHVANPDIPFAELISYFQAGDNFTHTYNKGNILNEKGEVYPEAWEAKKGEFCLTVPVGRETGAQRLRRLLLHRDSRRM